MTTSSRHEAGGKGKAGIGHNRPPADDTVIHRKVGGQIMLARGSVMGVTAITWTIMCEIARKNSGDCYWVTRRKTARMVAEMRGQPVDPSSINRAWQRMQKMGLISNTGRKHPETGATIWQMHYEPALLAYADWEAIRDRVLAA